jgi:hypothetical protein
MRKRCCASQQKLIVEWRRWVKLKIPRIGILDDAPMWQALRQALRELGYIESPFVRSRCCKMASVNQKE